MAEEEITQIPGERAETSAGGRLDNNPILKRGAVALAIVVFVAFALWSMRGQDKPSDGAQPERVVIRQTTDFEPAKEPVQPVAPLPQVQLPTPAVTEQAPTDDGKLLDAARRAPVIAYGGEKSPAPRRQDQDAATDQASNYVPLGANTGGFASQGENEDQRFNRLLMPTQLQGSRAGTLGNRDFIVAMGTSIPCVLETALSSDQPGFTSCVINRDILSDNGRVVLMEKGTQVVGEYRGGLRRGQKRLFVLWNRAKTPKGVIITLASPATDALGRAGVDGYVDTHWWERFGSAMLLSIVG
ncbi:TrbI/VirB10 family protein, partial [Rhizobium sp. Pop5]